MKINKGKHKRLTGVLEDLQGTKWDDAECSGQMRVAVIDIASLREGG